jgi:outer membrane biosynthesis protein TonB
MPSFPDIPGKGLLTDTSRRARVVAGAAATGALAAGGFVAKRVIDHVGADDAKRAPEPGVPPKPTAVKENPPPKPTAVKEKPAPKPKPAKPKAAKAKPPKPKADKPKAAKPKPPKPDDLDDRPRPT